MNGSDDDRDKRVIGLYGEMRLAMELHNRGWQVYRAYIDEKFDFVILKSYCENCQVFKNALTRQQFYKGKNRKAVTNLCETCKQDSLKMLVRFVQVKTSEGIEPETKKDEKTKKDEIAAPLIEIEPDTIADNAVKSFSFHPKIRYHLADSRVFYVWIQVWDKDNVNYYIFHTSKVKHFDDMSIDTYQITDNQKTELPITKSGKVTKKGRKYDYTVFEDFLNDFDCLEELIEGDSWK